MKIRYVLLLLVFASCSQLEGVRDRFDKSFSPPRGALAKEKEIKIKESERVAEYEFETQVSGEDAYYLAKKWLAKNLGNSNYAIQVDEKNRLEILTKATTECGTKEEAIGFNMELRFKNKKAKISFDSVMAKNSDFDSDTQEVGYFPHTKKQMSMFKKDCLDDIVVDIEKSTNKKADW